MYIPLDSITYPLNPLCVCTLHIHIYSYIHTIIWHDIVLDIRRPRPSPRPGRRLGPPEVWILSFLNPCHAQRCRQKPPQGHSNGSRAPHGRSNGFFYRRSRLPFARPQTLQTFQLLQKFAQLRREKVPQSAQHAPRPQAKATTRPQPWLKGTPRPQQWLLIGVSGCRLPGLKPSKSSKSPPNSAGKRYPNKLNTRHARRQKPPQGHSNGSRALCQASNAPNPPTVRPAPQGKGTPTSPTRATPARKSHHKATAMAQGHPTAAAMASYRRSRLPFARPQTLQTLQILQKSAQLRRKKVPQQAPHAPRPQAKATTRPQPWLKGTPRPQQWLLIGVSGCRLPGLKPSKSSKSPPNSAGKRYPNKLNTRHARRQKPPQGHSNGSRAPPAAAMASYRRSRLPFARPQTLQTLQKSAQLRREKVPQQAQHAPLPHAKATTRPQQWLKGTPRPQ